MGRLNSVLNGRERRGGASAAKPKKLKDGMEVTIRELRPDDLENVRDPAYLPLSMGARARATKLRS